MQEPGEAQTKPAAKEQPSSHVELQRNKLPKQTASWVKLQGVTKVAEQRVQAEHTVPPADLLNVPAAHAVHTCDEAALRTLPYEPAAHTVQRDALVVELYAPEAHAVHTKDVVAALVTEL